MSLRLKICSFLSKSDKVSIEKLNEVKREKERKALLKLEKRKKKNIKKHRRKMLRLTEGNILLLSILLVVIGVLIYTLSFLVSKNVEFYNNNIKNIVDDVSKILITIALGSCLLEWFGFVEYIHHRIRDIMIEDDYIETLTDEKNYN